MNAIHFPSTTLQAQRPSGVRAVCCGVLALVATSVLQAQTPAPAPDAAGKATKAPARSTAGSAQKATPPVTVNFINAEVDAVARAISAMINRPIAVDPRVKSPMTLYSEQAIPVHEAYLNFLSGLRGLGFAMVESGGILRIVPEAEAKLQATPVQVDEPNTRGDQVITQVFRIQHEAANNLVAVLRPLISPNNTINVSPGSNSLVITDYADNVRRMARIVAALDVPSQTDLEVVPLKHAVASDLAAVVQKVSDSSGAAAGAPGAPAAAGGIAGNASIIPDPRTNSLIVRASNTAKLNQVKASIAALDRPLQGAAATGNIWVVYLKNADATRLASVLRAAFAASGSPSGAGQTGGAAGGGTGAGAGGTPATATAIGSNPPAPSGIGGGTGSSLQASAPVQGSAPPSVGGFIQADPASNSLIITASEPLYRQIRAVVDQLDTRRAQVYVESLIVKIDASRAEEIGFQWQSVLGRNGDRNVLVGGTNFGTGGNNVINLQLAGASGTLTTPPGAGLNVGLLSKVGGAYTLASLARFLETQAGANVLSTPNLVALDNEEAKIVIGQNVPFVTGSFTNTAGSTGAINPFQTIERRDVGLTLRIRSQIGEGGTVRMQVFQENSSVVAGSSTTAGPTTDKSSIETSVVVDDGQIIVLGGLLKDENSAGDDRVPGLGNVPLLGQLFRSENKKRAKSNLMVFLRPVVLRDQQAADSVTLDRYEAIRALQLQVQSGSATPLGEADRGVLPAAAPGARPAGSAPGVPAPAASAPSNR